MITTGGHHLGGLPATPDLKDYRYMPAYLGVMTAPAMMSRTDLRPRLPPPFDQGNEASCGPNAGSGLMYHLYPGLAKLGFSRQQIYWDARPDKNVDTGTETREVMRVLEKNGALTEKVWPYTPENLWKSPPTNRPRYSLTTYSRLHSREDFVSCLSEGYPFLLGFTFYESTDSYRVAQTGIMVPPDTARESKIGTHIALVVGHDLNFRSSTVFKKSGIDPALVPDEMLLVRNSWGPKWGDGGHFWMPVSYATDMSTGGDAWTGRL